MIVDGVRAGSVHKAGYGHNGDGSAAQSVMARGVEAGDCRGVVRGRLVGVEGRAAVRREREPGVRLAAALSRRSAGWGGASTDPGDGRAQPGKRLCKQPGATADIDCGLAGTVMRFLPPVAALANGAIRFDGDPRSHERPLGPVIAALENLGLVIEHEGRYSLPMTLNATGRLNGGELDIDASTSSQFISALLLVGPATKTGITVRHVGAHLPSQPHIDMTVSMLKQFGATVAVSRSTEGFPQWRVEPGNLKGLDLIIEPDLSNAAPFMAAAMICGGDVTIKNWPKETTQPGDQLRNIFSKMGAKVSFSENDLKIYGTGEINGIDIDLHDVGELTPSIAAVAALAKSPSSLRNIGHLRLHETDRLSALATELNALGGDVDEEESALHISPSPLHSGIFHSYEDHRLATAGAMIGLVVNGIEVENIETTNKTLPDFPGQWSELLGN